MGDTMRTTGSVTNIAVLTAVVFPCCLAFCSITRWLKLEGTLKIINLLGRSGSAQPSLDCQRGSTNACFIPRNDYEKIIHQRTNTTAFDLAPLDDGTGVSVRVMKPLEAAELSLETVHEKFHPSVQSFPDVIGHYISGERPKGIQETEQMLKVGAALTGVGELVLDNNTIKLQPPKQGLRYYLTSADFDALLKKQESSAKLWKILTILFGFSTCAVLFYLLRKQYRHHQERRHLKQMQEEFRQAQERLMREVNAEGGETLKNACVICLSSAKSCVFLECGHVCSCSECYRALPEPKRCPICRQAISRVVPLYNS